MDTVLGLWGSLGPRKRLQFIGDILWALVSGVRGQLRGRVVVGGVRGHISALL